MSWSGPHPVPRLAGVAGEITAVTKYHGIHGGATVAFVGAAGVAVLLASYLGVRFVLTTTPPELPEPGPTTSALGPESPAVVNLLVNRWHLTYSAIAATLVDLAARRVVSLGDSPDIDIVQIPPRARLATGLTPYESQVLQYVVERGRDGSMPLASLIAGDNHQFVRFWDTFQQAVVAEATAAGLVRPARKAGDFIVLTLGLAVVFGLVALGMGLAHIGEGSVNSNGEVQGQWVWFEVMILPWLLGASTIGVGWANRVKSLRDTAAGRAACARWLGVREYLVEDGTFADQPPAAVTIWGRYLSFGVAVGVARRVATAIPLGLADNLTAWSRTGGTWHEIRLRYPRRFAYGHEPRRVFFSGLGRTVGWLAVLLLGGGFVVAAYRAISSHWTGYDSLPQHNRMLIVAAALLVPLGYAIWIILKLVDALIHLLRGAMDMGTPVVLEGDVVKVAEGRFAIDDGTSRVFDMLFTPRGVAGFGLGAHVRVTHSRHLRYVERCDVLRPAPEAVEGAGNAPTTAPNRRDLALDARVIGQLSGQPVTETGRVAKGSVVTQTFRDASGRQIVVERAVSRSAATDLGRWSTGQQAVRIPGIGDQAIWISGRAVVARHGDYLVTVEVTGGAGPPAELFRVAATLAAWLLSPSPSPPAGP